MLIKNHNITLKYISCIYKKKSLAISLCNQNLILKNLLILQINKNYCIYTLRYRSVFSSLKMSRYKMKEFFDNRTFSNIYIK